MSKSPFLIAGVVSFTDYVAATRALRTKKNPQPWKKVIESIAAKKPEAALTLALVEARLHVRDQAIQVVLDTANHPKITDARRIEALEEVTQLTFGAGTYPMHLKCREAYEQVVLKAPSQDIGPTPNLIRTTESRGVKADAGQPV